MFLKSGFALRDCFQLPFFELAHDRIPVFQNYAGKKRCNKSMDASGTTVAGTSIRIGNVRSGTEEKRL